MIIESIKDRMNNDPLYKAYMDRESPLYIYEHLQYHKDNIYSYKAMNALITRLWYKKINGQWNWTPYDPFVNENVWIPTSVLIVPFELYSGYPPADINALFIHWLSENS